MIVGIILRIIGPKLFAAIPWRLLTVVALLAGLASLYWALDNAAYHRGFKADRVLWIAADAKAAKVAATIKAQRDADAASAVVADAERTRLAALKIAPIIEKATRYAQTPAARARCVDAIGRVLEQQAIDAARARAPRAAGPRR